ncbi:MAG TPA: acyl-CoA desaturase [Polyangiaceae bacterium]|nr:acyl-CoA desaturase [Polyangiaceae bacterium]
MSSTTPDATIQALLSTAPSAEPETRADAALRRTDWVGAAPFLAFHVLAVAYVLVAGFSLSGLGLAVALYYLRMFGVTGGYHRYFSHRSFKTSRAFQFVLAFLAMTSVQKGVLWWASHHRLHHKNSDLPGDVHSAKLDGFVWSHVGWILSRQYQETEGSRVRDLAKYPELVFLNRFHLVPPIVYGVVLYLLGGTWALGWGLLVSTVLLWHGTFTINSLSHVFGGRRYRTTDESRNNYFLALVTMGEGFHNNHHYYQRSANQGFYWWEFDATYLVLRALALVGIVWDVHRPPRHVLDANRI